MNHDDAGERIHWLCALLIDAMKWQQGASAYVMNQDQQVLAHQLASHYASPTLQAIVQQWFQCRQQLLTVVSVNRELLLTEQLLNWEQQGA